MNGKAIDTPRGGVFGINPRRCPDCCKDVDFSDDGAPAPHDCSFPTGFWATLVQILTGR